MHIKAVNTLEIRLVDEADALFESTLNGYIKQLEQASGCLGYSATRSANEPALWVVSGYWDSTANMTNHFCDDAMAAFTEWLVALRASLVFGTFERVLVEDPAYGTE